MKCILIAILLSLGLSEAQSKNIITHVTLTYYQPVKAQCDKQPLITADGSKINLHHLKKGKLNGVQYLVIYSTYFQK